MRRITLSIGMTCLLSAAALPAAIVEPQQTPDDLVCKYRPASCVQTAAADAADESFDEAGPTQPRGPTKGFSLRRPTDVPATKLASVTTPRAPRPAPRPAIRQPAPTVSHDDLLITFENGSARLTEQGQANARAFAQMMQRPQLVSARFAIAGHTNSTGSHDANVELSRRRAQAVVDFLASLGVAANRLQVEGWGPDRPLPDVSPTADANRRVEARLLLNG